MQPKTQTRLFSCAFASQFPFGIGLALMRLVASFLSVEIKGRVVGIIPGAVDPFARVVENFSRSPRFRSTFHPPFIGHPAIFLRQFYHGGEEHVGDGVLQQMRLIFAER